MSNRFQDRGFVQLGSSPSAPVYVIITPTTAANSAISVIASANATTTILAANSNRVGATIYNNANKTMYLALAAGATNLNFTVALDSNGSYYEVPSNYTGIITGYWPAGVTGSAYATELTP
jgi:hypothetical protein